MLDKNNIPEHIAIILDGNGRWARKRGLPRSFGHRVGIKRIKQIVNGSRELGIKTITLFVFSTENWQRPKREVDMLMRAFSDFLDNDFLKLHKDNIRLRVIGHDRPLPPKLLTKIKQTEESSAKNSALTVVLALNYGGRAEIVEAAVRFARAVKSDVFKIDQLNEQTFSRFLCAPDLSFPDLLIRTSGELRVSNFLLWQLAYTELYFVEKYWPDFTKEDLIKAVVEYQRRQRRFGRA